MVLPRNGGLKKISLPIVPATRYPPATQCLFRQIHPVTLSHNLPYQTLPVSVQSRVHVPQHISQLDRLKRNKVSIFPPQRYDENTSMSVVYCKPGYVFATAWSHVEDGRVGVFH